MKKVNIGLDLGIASLGWSIVEIDTKEIIDAGIYLFEEANNSNSSTTSSSDRRAIRSRRRMLRRRNLRKRDLLIKFKELNLINSTEDFYKIDRNIDYLEIRKKALVEQISKDELMLILFNYLKHRGSFNFKDDLQEIKKISDDEISIEDISSKKLSPIELHLSFKEKYNKYRGEKIKNDENSLINHEWYIEEINLIFDKQISFDKSLENLKEEFFKIYNRKRNYYDGPGYQNKKNNILSPYGWKDEIDFFDRLAGKDTYDNNELRAPKHCLTSYLFNILNDLNNLKIESLEEGLSREQKEYIIESAINHDSKKAKNISLKEIAKFLQVDSNTIKGYRINTKDEPIFTEFESINKIRRKLLVDNEDYSFLSLKNINEIDKICEILTKYQSIDNRVEELVKSLSHFLTKRQCELIGEISLTGTHSLSIKTMNKVIEHTWTENKEQMEVFKDLGMKPDYKFSKLAFTNLKTIPVFRKKISEMYISPVVKRSFIQTLNLIKEIEKNYKNIEIKNIVIELAREKNSEDIRLFKTRINKENEDNKKIVNSAYGLDFSSSNSSSFKGPSKNTLLKFMLLNEQDNKCIYSGKTIDIDRLKTDENYCEIDHIIPLSKSFDDSRTNKVLCLREENQNKGQMTPYEYFRKIGRNWEEFKMRCLTTYLSKNKSKYFFTKVYENLFLEDDLNTFAAQQKFISRNLNDTRYATVEVKNYLNFFKKELKKEWKIKVINGKFTAYLRNKVFYIQKDRNQFKHHGIDATIIALSSLIKLSKSKNILDILEPNLKDQEESIELDYDKLKSEYAVLGSKIDNFDYKFSKKTLGRTNLNLFDETIYSAKVIDNKVYKKRKFDLFESNGQQLDKHLNKNFENVLMYQNDKKTFSYLKEIFNEYYNKTWKDENNKEHKITNPFVYYRDILGKKIEKQSNEEKRPEITKITYLQGAEIYYDISHKYKNIKKDKKVIMTSMNSLAWDLFYNKHINKYKILPINAKVAYFNFISNDKRDIVINEENYKKCKQDIKITKDFQYLFRLKKYDEIEFDYDGVHERFIIVGFDLNKERMELKYINRFNEKSERKSISKVKNLIKINSNITKTKMKIFK
ncbi:type II CRISPR RNA-guided endonuclease Cas9 [Spiroplasma endosymbiont of Cantharis nigra]|uniref:type II CRISPR RNA-guided endonuclease Cas9 n=1 Tax=Spiroplasma endosymbiont of Cantharis nigra TaxID=3066278 RepID=UPI0030D2E703